MGSAFLKILVPASFLLLMSSCKQDSSESAGSDLMLDSATKPKSMTTPVSANGPRWYSPNQVGLGARVFADNCSVCHGASAQGNYEDWKQKLADGSFVPPPLNGNAHAWHHPLSVLLGVINQGGVAYGGKMPSFEASLNEQEKLAVIAYFQDFWSTETYDKWLQMGGTN